jgi:nucleoid-associated protein EbfC
MTTPDPDGTDDAEAAEHAAPPELVDGDEPPFALDSLLQSAQQMQQQLVEAQNEVAATVVEGQAGGGAVKVEVNGGFEFIAVHIAAEAVDPDDVEMLEDLVLAALHDAAAKIAELQSQSLQSGMGGLDALGGLGGLGGLGELFGGGSEPPSGA